MNAERSSAARAANPLRDRVFRRLFAAQVTTLLGTGLTTVALSLLAYDLAGKNAAAILGTVLALKMIAYVTISPIASTYAVRLDPKRLMVTLDLLRGGVVLSMVAINAVWQVYVAVFVLSSLTAMFTPAFQATIPRILEDESEYTTALSYSRVAYELEVLASPLLAAAALSLLAYNELFVLDGVTFLASALLIGTASIAPVVSDTVTHSAPWRRSTEGIRKYLAVPQLRALLALSFAVAAASAMVIVNTVVFVLGEFGRSDSDVALALASAGLGSLLMALAVPRLIRISSERLLMVGGGCLLPLGLALAALPIGWYALIAIWFLLGVGLSAVQTPAGRLVQRAVTVGDGPELFAAQFALSHACWLITYPLAGLLENFAGLAATAGVLAILSLASVTAAAIVWPTSTPAE